MADRHLVTIDVNGRHATFATAGENAWKDSVRSAVEATGVQAQGGRFALRMEFRLPETGNANEVWDLDNLIKPTLDAMERVFGLRARKGPAQADDERVDRIEASKHRVNTASGAGATIDVWVIDRDKDLPLDLDRPFFAYGIFKPGQLAFFQLRDLIIDVAAPVRTRGSLRLRDGLPIADPEAPAEIVGALLAFSPDQSAAAYRRISDMEPGRHYRWHEAQVDGAIANMLVGKSPLKGSVLCEDAEWDGWSDPLLTAALDVAQETLASSKQFERDLKPLFRLQMAYLLLWSSIERYVSLRYHLGDKVAEKVGQLANEPTFAAALKRYVTQRREVYRADRPQKKEILDPASPRKSLDYYYQVRCNITHRGKGVVRDYQILQSSLQELLAIFRDMLNAARDDASRDAYTS
jgi:Holliday junction resolvase RusA-like endonuclease